MTFKDGGAFDFHSTFERIKERLQQVVQQARETGVISSHISQRAGAYSGVNFTNVHLEDLPAYEGPQPTTTSAAAVNPPPFSGGGNANVRASESSQTSTLEERFEPPNEPPPGYEEAQQQGVANDLEDRLRQVQ